jgi:hypothetical protein
MIYIYIHVLLCIPMNQQIQESKTQVRKSSTIGKAHVIACSRRIHKSSQGDIWMVESGSSTNGKFYKVQYLEETKSFFCECKAFEYGNGSECKHILGIALLQGKRQED